MIGGKKLYLLRVSKRFGVKKTTHCWNELKNHKNDLKTAKNNDESLMK